MDRIKKWVWQHEDYPNFTYDHKALDSILSKVTRNTGKLEGIIESLNNKSITSIKIDASTNEILASSEIEGEILSRDSVRSSVRKKLDETFDCASDHSTYHTDGLVDILIDSSLNHNILTVERLHGWHNALFPTGYSGMLKIDVAQYRTGDMSVVSNKGTSEKVHYVAPISDAIHKDMDAFFDYVNNAKENPYVKSAIAHLWFVLIHPYDDGNGRITRAITNYILSRELGFDHKYFSISSAVKNDLKGYYDVLERSGNLFYNRDLDFTEWVLWHTNMINSAIHISLKSIKTITDKTRFWDRVRDKSLNEKQGKVIKKLLDAGQGGFEGGLTNKKYRAITKTSPATANRHIKDLLDKEIIYEIEGYSGRSTRYDILWDG